MLSGLIAKELRNIEKAIQRTRPVITPFIGDARTGGSYLEIKRVGERSRVPLISNTLRSRSTGSFR